VHPVIVKIGPIPVYSFGLMVVIAFLVAGWLTSKELQRREMEPAYLEGFPMAALLGGLVGARTYYLIAHWHELLHDPFASLFSGSGLTWYGGLLGGAVLTLALGHRRTPITLRHGRVGGAAGTIALWVVLGAVIVVGVRGAPRLSIKLLFLVPAVAVLLARQWTLWPGTSPQVTSWSLCDAFAPGLAAAYGIGRIGCQLAGDGDYGPPSTLPWAMAYPHGVVPTDVPVHPTPVYEVLMMAGIVAILWRARRSPRAPGWLFGLYLVLVGIERWVSEFFRVRFERPLGLSVAQWISLAVVLGGIWLMSTRRRHA
jgi:phosphatidylglycerol:prolipoprotein diacylglycerol transferase